MMDDFNRNIENTYLQMLNATPSSMIPEDNVLQMKLLTFDGVSKEILNLQLLEQKLNDVNTALTNFEAKSNEWHDFLIRAKSDMDINSEVFKQYLLDEKNTLRSINNIKSSLLTINDLLSILKDTLKQ